MKDVDNKDKEMNKSYTLLFTCASTRNVHLELTPNMESASVIRAIKRFFSRRDIIRMFISDNFRSFLAEELQPFFLDVLELSGHLYSQTLRGGEGSMNVWLEQ